MTGRLLCCALALALPGVAVCRPAVPNEAPADPEIERLVDRYHQAGQFNGALLVADARGVRYRGAAGHADETFCVPAEPSHRFQIGSITKPFTAALALRLADRGRVDLDVPIERYLPDYDPVLTRGTTLHHLLTHTAGVADAGDAESFVEMMSTPLSSFDALHRYCAGERPFAPGEGWSYSNCGYQLAGAVLERVAKEPFRALLRGLLDAAGLEATGLTDTREIVSRMARGYSFDEGGWRPIRQLDWSNSLASGALYSTVDDLYRWQSEIFDGGLVSAASKRRLLTPVRMDYAYGWYVGEGSAEQVGSLLSSVRDEPVTPDGADVRLAMHSGDLPGYHSILVRLFEPQGVVVVLDNHDLTGIYDHRRIARLATDLVRLLLGESPLGPQPAYGPGVIPPGARDALPCR